MRAYLIRRLLLVIPTLFILSVLVFLSVRFIPGDVIDVMAGRIEAMGGGQVDRAAMERRLGLDLPIHVQYGRWIGGILLRGTLGESLLGGWRIEERMLGRLPVTAELGVLAILIGLVIALPVGIYSAVRQYTAADYVGRSVAIMGLATPNFWLGTMVMIYPAIWWAWSPPMEFHSLSEDPLGVDSGRALPGIPANVTTESGQPYQRFRGKPSNFGWLPEWVVGMTGMGRCASASLIEQASGFPQQRGRRGHGQREDQHAQDQRHYSSA